MKIKYKQEVLVVWGGVSPGSCLSLNERPGAWIWEEQSENHEITKHLGHWVQGEFFSPRVHHALLKYHDY